MTGLTSIWLQLSTPTFTPPATAARPARRLPSSSSPCTALSLPLFSKRAAGRCRAGAGPVAVARYGDGRGDLDGDGRGDLDGDGRGDLDGDGDGDGGGFLPELGRGRRSSQPRTGSDYGDGGGFLPELGRGRRSSEPRTGSDSDDEALDFTRIASSSVRLIDEQQNMIGVVSLEEAMQRADDAELDLVILAADADPPVLKIFDYNKYRYEQKRKKRDQKKSAASRMDIKEVKMGYNIDSHDYSVRLRAAQRFLKDGDKVKVIVNLKRRENDFRFMAIELLKRFQHDIGELATEESKNFSDRNLFIVLLPNKAVLRKGQEQQPKEEAAPATEVVLRKGQEQQPKEEEGQEQQPKEEEAPATEVVLRKGQEQQPKEEAAPATEVSANV